MGLVEVVKAAAYTERETLQSQLLLSEFAKIFEAEGYSFGQEGEADYKSTRVAKADFAAIISHNPDAIQVLRTTDVDPMSLIDLLDSIFHVDPLPFCDILAGVLSLRNCNVATVK